MTAQMYAMGLVVSYLKVCWCPMPRPKAIPHLLLHRMVQYKFDFFHCIGASSLTTLLAAASGAFSAAATMSDSEDESYVFFGTALQEEVESRAGQHSKAVQDPSLTKSLPVWKQVSVYRCCLLEAFAAYAVPLLITLCM